jgi:NAD+ kinase
MEEHLGKLLTSGSRHLKLPRTLFVPRARLPVKCDVLVVLGGDGMMLEAARIVGAYSTPILGVNLGKLGFLAEVAVEDMNQTVLDVIARKTSTEARMTLEVYSVDRKKTFYSFNEVVIDKGSSPRIIHIETHVNRDYLATYAADGIIVATPTGSTAYSLASGGPIVAPESRVFAITPISPHTLTARPVLVPDTVSIRLIAHSPKADVRLIVDGQAQQPYPPGAEFRIKKSGRKIILVKRRHSSYYDILREKLFWGRDLRLHEPHNRKES